MPSAPPVLYRAPCHTTTALLHLACTCVSSCISLNRALSMHTCGVPILCCCSVLHLSMQSLAGDLYSCERLILEKDAAVLSAHKPSCGPRCLLLQHRFPRHSYICTAALSCTFLCVTSHYIANAALVALLSSIKWPGGFDSWVADAWCWPGE